MAADNDTKPSRLLNGWDRVRPTTRCPHCDGTGRAPGDGRTECGFCEEDDRG